jgi:hypothetical protein
MGLMARFTLGIAVHGIMAGIGIPTLLPNAYRLNDTKAVCTQSTDTES